MKKLFSIILVVTLIFSVTMVPGYAMGKFTPPGLAKKGGLPPGIAKKFLDIDGYEWARNAIEKMAEKGIIKGIDEVKFAPASSVTKVEALAMIMRVLDWQNDAEEYKDLIIKGKKERQTKGKVQDWGIGYVELAEEIGLLDEVDVMQQNFNTPATRQEIAKYIIRALDFKDTNNGYVDEAEDNMDVNLRFKDASAVQTGSVGYVYLIDKLGIMVGNSDNTFQPNKPVTRAEMATLVDRLDGKIEKDISNVTGVITDIDDDEIEIKVNGSNKEYDLADDVKILDSDGDRTRLSNLTQGMTVKLFLEDNEVIEIRVVIKTEAIEGEFVQYDDDEITLKVNNRDKTFDVDRNVDVSINDENADLEDLEDLEDLSVKVTIELTLENGKVIAIECKYEEEYELEGRITNIYNDDEKITVKYGSKSKTLYVTNDTDIEIDDKNSDFDELVVGMEVELRIIENELVELYAFSFEKDYEGKLLKIEGGAQNKITLEINNSQKIFVVDEDVEIEINDDDASFADLLDEYYNVIEIETVNNIVVKITID